MSKIVCVEWEDACSNSGYYDKDHPEKFAPVMCRTVGHLIKRNKESVIVACEAFEDGGKREIHTVPRKMVKKITYLTEAK